MKTDITFAIENKIFNYRVAIIIKKKDKILIQKDKRANHITLPGGRCELGETSTNAAIREFQEETGINCTFKKEIGMIENFFTSSFNKKEYEKNIIHNIEKEKQEFITYEWLTIAELKKLNFKPDIILDVISNENFSYHIKN